MDTVQTFHHIEVVYDPRAYVMRDDVRQYVDSMDWHALSETLPPCIVVLGGDWMLLHAIAQFQKFGCWRVMTGANRIAPHGF